MRAVAPPPAIGLPRPPSLKLAPCCCRLPAPHPAMAVRASNTSGGGPASSPQQSQSQPAAGSQSSTAIPGFDDESMDILLEDYIAELTPEEFLRNGVSIDKKWRTDPAPKKPRTVTINQAKLEYVLPGAEEQYAADLEPHIWSVSNIVRPKELRDIQRSMLNLDIMRDNPIDWPWLGYHAAGIPHQEKIQKRLSKLPLFKGLQIRPYRVRPEPWDGGIYYSKPQHDSYYTYKAVIPIPAGGKSCVNIEFHHGQSTSYIDRLEDCSYIDRLENWIATLAVPPGEGYITSIPVVGKDPYDDPDSKVYKNMSEGFHYVVPDDLGGVSLVFNIGDPVPTTVKHRKARMWEW